MAGGMPRDTGATSPLVPEGDPRPPAAPRPERGLTHTWEEASPQKGEGVKTMSIGFLFVSWVLGWLDFLISFGNCSGLSLGGRYIFGVR